MKWSKFIIKEIFGSVLIPVYFLGLFATSSIIVFQVVLTLVKQRFSKYRNKPYFKQRLIFPGDEPPIVSNLNWKNYKFNGKVPYEKLNEGFGGAYERIAYTNILKKLAKKYNAKKVLELNSTYIAGVPAFNSSILAQDGYDLTITVHTRD
ncbi:MAG TPA: hypothetical protein VJ399_00195, partial [Patescibacteria group bacterium]|nr:hypothetical protein [Patescibacteria group bacterium]